VQQNCLLGSRKTNTPTWSEWPITACDSWSHDDYALLSC